MWAGSCVLPSCWALTSVSHLISPPTLRNQHPSLRFTEENRKGKKDEVTCPRSQPLSDSHRSRLSPTHRASGALHMVHAVCPRDVPHLCSADPLPRPPQLLSPLPSRQSGQGSLEEHGGSLSKPAHPYPSLRRLSSCSTPIALPKVPTISRESRKFYLSSPNLQVPVQGLMALKGTSQACLHHVDQPTTRSVRWGSPGISTARLLGSHRKPPSGPPGSLCSLQLPK